MWSVSSLLPPLKCVGVVFWFPLSAWKYLSCALHWGIRTVLELGCGHWDIDGMEAAERHCCGPGCAVLSWKCDARFHLHSSHLSQCHDFVQRRNKPLTGKTKKTPFSHYYQVYLSTSVSCSFLHLQVVCFGSRHLGSKFAFAV